MTEQSLSADDARASAEFRDGYRTQDEIGRLNEIDEIARRISELIAQPLSDEENRKLNMLLAIKGNMIKGMRLFLDLTQGITPEVETQIASYFKVRNAYEAKHPVTGGSASHDVLSQSTINLGNVICSAYRAVHSGYITEEQLRRYDVC